MCSIPKQTFVPGMLNPFYAHVADRASQDVHEIISRSSIILACGVDISCTAGGASTD